MGLDILKSVLIYDNFNSRASQFRKNVKVYLKKMENRRRRPLDLRYF